ncbi:hypothetical protein PENTCL1PPCAC_18816, partial [Pristionchus entomophagus]
NELNAAKPSTVKPTTISTSKPIAMCPCVQTSQSTCQEFDRRYQAHTIEDAIDNFYDLTYDKAASSIVEDEYCETEECKNCRLILQQKLKEVGLMEESPLEAFVTVDLTNKTCGRYRFSSPEELARSYLRDFYIGLRNEALRFPQIDAGLAAFFAIFEIFEIEEILENEVENPKSISRDQNQKSQNKKTTSKNSYISMLAA